MLASYCARRERTPRWYGGWTRRDACASHTPGAASRTNKRAAEQTKADSVNARPTLSQRPRGTSCWRTAGSKSHLTVLKMKIKSNYFERNDVDGGDW